MLWLGRIWRILRQHLMGIFGTSKERIKWAGLCNLKWDYVRWLVYGHEAKNYKVFFEILHLNIWTVTKGYLNKLKTKRNAFEKHSLRKSNALLYWGAELAKVLFLGNYNSSFVPESRMVSKKTGPLSSRIHLLSLVGRLGKIGGLIHWQPRKISQLAAELDENLTKTKRVSSRRCRISHRRSLQSVERPRHGWNVEDCESENLDDQSLKQGVQGVPPVRRYNCTTICCDVSNLCVRCCLLSKVSVHESVSKV